MIGIKIVGKKVLCKSCGTKKYYKLNNFSEEDYGVIVIHKKDCIYLKHLLENSVEV